MLPVQDQVAMVEIELAKGEVSAVFQRLKPRCSCAGRCRLKALSPGDQYSTLEVPRIAYYQRALKVLFGENLSGLFDVLDRGGRIPLHEDHALRDVTFNTVFAGNFALGVGGSSALSAGQDERTHTTLKVEFYGMIKPFLEDRRGFVVPRSSSEDNCAVCFPAVILKAITADDDELPDEIQCQKDRAESYQAYQESN